MEGRIRQEGVELDGRTGEGGGQLVRIAVGLSALTGIPVRVHHVRANRPGRKGKHGGGRRIRPQI
jgi:RNA 3'-terminal phosphate cyclase (ATP)